MTTEHKVIGGIVLLTLIIIIGGAVFSDKNVKEDAERISQSVMGEKMPDMGAVHVDPGETHEEYNSNPPTSGPHWAGVAGPGVKNEIVADELVLHSMEHGAAVVWYRADLNQDDIDKIKEAFNSASGKKIMLPRVELDVPVALTSWGYLLKLDIIDVEKIKEFIEINNDRAPEKAPI